MKRLILLILACLSLQMAFAYNQWGYKYIDGLCYYLDSSAKTAWVEFSTDDYPERYPGQNYKGITKIEIPASVTYNNITYNVTTIGSYAFYGCTDLESVTIPSSVTLIGTYAFYGCPNLKSITVPSSVTAINYEAFYNCSNLQLVVFRGGTPPVWQDYLFSRTPEDMLVILPSGSKSKYLSSANFSKTGLSNKDIREGIVNNSLMYAITSDETNAAVGGIPGYTVPNVITMESQVEYNGKTVPVTEIYKNAFSGRTNITSVTFPETLKTIGNNAFEGCTGLTKVTYPETLQTLEAYAFSGCKDLTAFTFPETLKTIGNNAFEGCTGLSEVNVPATITSIGTDAFKGTTGLKRLYLERGDEELTVSTPFTNSGVDYLFLGRDVKGTLGMGTALKTLQVASNVNYIDANQFKGCSNLESVNIFAGNLKTIKANAFEECKALTEITIPNNVETIESGAFKYCSALETVTLPIKLTQIADETFFRCDNLKNITLPQGITIIGKNAFVGCAFPSINLPEGLTEIQESAFAASNLNQISFPSTLKKIGNRSFSECAFTEVIIPDNIESLGEGAFYGCYDLKYVRLSNKLKIIPQLSFADCYVLEEVELPNNLEIIEDDAFISSPLESIDLPVTLTSIGAYAFYGNNFQELTIPAGVKSIGANAFANNTGLIDIYSLSTTPPTCADASVFDTATKRSARLFVPASSVEDYMSYICWKDFTYYEPITALNTIEIHGETDRLRVNKTLDLTLSVTPDDVTSVKVVWSSSNPAVATVDQTGHVTAISQGFTVISAKAQDIVAAEGIYPLTVISYLIGDSNESDSVTITDAVNIASYVMGQEPDVFNFDASDVNENGVITLADASGVISIVLDELGSAQPSNSAMRKPAINHDGKLVARNSNNLAETSISLDADREITALQAYIKAADGQKIEDVIISDDIKASHSLISKRISDNEIRLVLYSPALNILPENPASLFTVKTSGNSAAAIEIDNILATGSDLNEYSLGFERGTTTGIDGNFSDSIKVTAENGHVTVSNAAGCEIRVNNLHGMTVAAVREAGDVETFSLNAGIYIVTVDGKAYKIAVR